MDITTYIYEEFLMEVFFITACLLFIAPLLMTELVEKLKRKAKLQAKNIVLTKEINHRKVS